MFNYKKKKNKAIQTKWVNVNFKVKTEDKCLFSTYQSHSKMTAYILYSFDGIINIYYTIYIYILNFKHMLCLKNNKIRKIDWCLANFKMKCKISVFRIRMYAAKKYKNGDKNLQLVPLEAAQNKILAWR